MWNISLKHHQISDSFIVCGVMYAVDHVDERNTKIRFALDLYKNKLLDLELPFTNPFSYTTMLGYNSRLQVHANGVTQDQNLVILYEVFPIRKDVSNVPKFGTFET